MRLRAEKVTGILRHVPALAAICAAAFSPARAQSAGLELGFGLWLRDSVATIYSVALQRPLLGPFDYGLGLTHLQRPADTVDPRLTGGEVSLGLFRDGDGPFVVAAAGLGMRHSSGDFDAQWSVGGGYDIRVLRVLSLGMEARYRVEDRASRGFWRLDPADGRGAVIQAHVSFRFGAARRESRPRRQQDAYGGIDRLPTAAPSPRAESPREVAELRYAVVATAIEVMGTPYTWGGEDDGGFDCSGLIRYAYGEHGLILPRTSSDQARMGAAVELAVTSLEPGDVLGFSDGGGGVTHVGLYVGEGRFIHSSSSGVMLSSLTAADGDGSWWRRRWVAARRLIN